MFTLTERKTYVAKALDIIERKYKSIFYNKLKTITFDNGGEFRNRKSLEKYPRAMSNYKSTNEILSEICVQ